VPPRGDSPSGLILVDKPAGPSSFAIVAEVRRRTGARTGHAGTLDPFATGLLLLLSGKATKLASCFVGLDKRYVTEIDLGARTSTGDLEGSVLERSNLPGEDELARRLERLRGEIELPIPAASAVKIGGERAYRLHRRGVQVEMPLRRSRIEALELLAYSEGVARLDLLVSSGTYVRALAEALGGHCRSLRRTEVGPFRVEEADLERIVSPDEALARLGFDGVHRGHERVLAAVGAAGDDLVPTVVTFSPHPRAVLGNQVELLSSLERRLELIAASGIAETLVVEFTP
jgi:tRNA pseudouridine55 synthase